MIAMGGNIRTMIGRLIVAHPDGEFVRLVCRYFGRLGWRIYLASSGTVARRLARSTKSSVVLLATDNHEESGWLTCAKLTRELPAQKVVLVGNDARPTNRRLSKFVGGATLVNQKAGIGALIDHVYAAAGEPEVRSQRSEARKEILPKP